MSKECLQNKIKQIKKLYEYIGSVGHQERPNLEEDYRRWKPVDFLIGYCGFMVMKGLHNPKNTLPNKHQEED